MAEASCRRELELEIPAEEVSKKMESVAKEFARLATIPGFRRGKAPVSLIRRRFAEDIKGEVLQTLVPERVEKAVVEQKLTPVSQPKVEAGLQRRTAAEVSRGVRSDAGIPAGQLPRAGARNS